MNATTKLDLIALEDLEGAAECLRTLGHPIRLRILQMLLHGQYTVGELAEACEIRSNVASEHLRLMQHSGFLARRQEGRRMYYQVIEPALGHIMSCIEERFRSPSS